jgi:2-polyprenyl-6-methoxyphenol hydroxylase-like FAD-dependent oxidoreductase
MRVLVCGAGIAGLTFALSMSRYGHEVRLVEKAPALRGKGYMLDFFASGYDACEKLGLVLALERIHYPIERLVFVDPSGRERVSLEYATVRRRIFHDRHFNFLRGDLERVLFSALPTRVDVRFGRTIAAIRQLDDHAEVVLSDGETDAFDLVVGADGVHSHVRRLAFGAEGGFTRFVGCYAAAFILNGPLRGIDLGDAFVTVTTPGRLVSAYPIRGGRIATLLVWRAREDEYEASNASALQALRSVYDGMGWFVPELLERADAGAEIYFDAVTQVVMRRWNNGRVVLIGDACQCVSLLAGQGASMAAAGGYVLSDELASRPDDVPGALARYARRVRPAAARKQAAGRKIAAWFVPNSTTRIALRDFALRTSTWPIAAGFMRRRLGAESSSTTRCPRRSRGLRSQSRANRSSTRSTSPTCRSPWVP